jgi:hypothetical protein
MQRPALLAALGAAGLAALYLAFVARSPVSLGFFGDDATYATTAKALAEGRGYRHLSIPGEPLQTKYPPLYPAALSLVIRSLPDREGGQDLLADFRWLLVPTALAGAGALVLSALYWHRILGASGRMTIAVAALAALSPAWLAYMRVAMSELPYALLATAALLCLDQREPRAEGRWSTARLMLGAALVGGAMLTRTIGVSLAIAAVATPLLRRRRWDALLIAAVILTCVAPWWSFQSSAAVENGAAGRDFLTAYELGYSGWLPDGPQEALRIVGQNLLRLCFSLGYFQLALPVGFVRAAIAEGSVRLVLLHAVCYAALLFALWGFWLSARSGIRILHVYAALYGGIILIWTYSPHRFLVPWTPFLIFFAATGLRAALRAHWLAWIAYAAVLALFLAEDGKLARSTERDYYARELAIDWTELRDVERFLREHTQPEDVIASSHPERFFLSTGRRGHYFWPVTDPVALDYAPERAASRFTILPAPAEARARSDEVIRHLAEVYREAKISWYVDWSTLEHARGFSHAARGAPGRFELRHTTPGKTFAVYRVRIPES